jgi:hypothetical protein
MIHSNSVCLSKDRGKTKMHTPLGSYKAYFIFVTSEAIRSAKNIYIFLMLDTYKYIPDSSQGLGQDFDTEIVYFYRRFLRNCNPGISCPKFITSEAVRSAKKILILATS